MDLGNQYDVEGAAGNTFDLEVITETEKREAEEALKAHGAEGLKNFLSKKLDEWKDVPLNIGITGASGCGKSTFINTMRGLCADDPEAARVGVTETTMEPKAYPHPQHGGFTLWDLPGAGTPNFPRETYLAKVGFEKYDFFLIMSSRRFTEDDLWLGKEVQQRGKLFFFIRTRIDEDMQNDKDDHPSTHDEDKVLAEVRENCETNLAEKHIKAHVFLISGKKKYETCWDFPTMNKTLIDNLPGLKRHAMVLSVTANSRDVIEAKCDALRSRIWKVAAASAAVAAVPIPGLSIFADMALLVNEITTYKQQLGLDADSLRKMAVTHGIPEQDLNSAISTIMPNAFFKEVQKWILDLLKQQAVGTAVEEFSKYIPILGSIIAGGVSFATTVVVLRRVLDQLKEAALAVLQMVIEKSRQDI